MVTISTFSSDLKELLLIMNNVFFIGLQIESQPRLEPFSPGQVYNSSKGSQVHVIAAATT